MQDKRSTKAQLLTELTTLRNKVSVLEQAESDHRQVKKSLREIEKIFSSFMEHSPIYVFFKDETTRAIRLSKNYEQMLGKPMNELINKTVYELFPSDLAKSMATDDLRILHQETVYKVEEELNGRIYSTIKFPIFIESKKKYLAGFTMDITDQKKIEADRQNVVEQLRKTLGATIQAMAATVEVRDPYTAGHQRRVSDLARSIATEMKLSRDQIEGLRMASVIHDIGKIAIPAEILSKPTTLTKAEIELIKTHPQTGYEVLKDIEFPWPIARIVLEHHERIDGSGYPKGLNKKHILLESMILMVADTVEAIASHRPYRPGLGIDFALDEIRKSRGVCYEATVVDACVRLFHDKGYELGGFRVFK